MRAPKSVAQRWEEKTFRRVTEGLSANHIKFHRSSPPLNHDATDRALKCSQYSGNWVVNLCFNCCASSAIELYPIWWRKKVKRCHIKIVIKLHESPSNSIRCRTLVIFGLEIKILHNKSFANKNIFPRCECRGMLKFLATMTQGREMKVWNVSV